MARFRRRGRGGNEVGLLLVPLDSHKRGHAQRQHHACAQVCCWPCRVQVRASATILQVRTRACLPAVSIGKPGLPPSFSLLLLVALFFSNDLAAVGTHIMPSVAKVACFTVDGAFIRETGRLAAINAADVEVASNGDCIAVGALGRGFVVFPNHGGSSCEDSFHFGVRLDNGAEVLKPIAMAQSPSGQVWVLNNAGVRVFA